MVLRQLNIFGQWRIDVPHIKAMESSVAADFDLLAGRIMGGEKPLIVKGFEILTTGALNNLATSLKMSTAGSILIHYLASESGSIFFVPSDRALEQLTSTNTRVVGAFTANQVNYVGLDLRRTADSSTSDLVMVLDAQTVQEQPKTVPLGRTLDYVITISTTDFSSTPGICPVAKITTDANNNVTAIEDARGMAFRLGNGGVTPNRYGSFSWPAGRREVVSATGNVFSGGDKAITSFKDWQDAVMTRLWEIGGGEFWYSSTADRNATLTATGTAFASNQEYFEWDGTHLHWKGLKWVFENSGNIGPSNAAVWYNDVTNQTTDLTGLTDLADGECIYVDLDRTANRTSGTALVAVKGVTANLGAPVIPGARQIIAWRIGSQVWTRNSHFPVGTFFAITPLSPDPTGTYSNPTITVDQFGRVTSASTGTINTGVNWWLNGVLVDTTQTLNFTGGSISSVTSGAGVTTVQIDNNDTGAIFGPGTDGTATLDGTTNYNNFSSRSGSTYTLTRDTYLQTLTVNSGVTLNCKGFRLFVRGVLTVNSTGKIHNNGLDASGGTGGAGGGSGTSDVLGDGGAGGDGGDIGVDGQTITYALGGNGGQGGHTVDGSDQGAAGVATPPAAGDGGFRDVVPMTTGHIFGNGAVHHVRGGGGGGGGANLDSGGTGGGGGGGGGVLLIVARTIVNNGTISANGGNGAPGAGSVDEAAGGGGGGGGLVMLTYRTKSGSGTITATHGTGGLAPLGSTTATAGDNGADGLVLELAIL